MISDSDRYYGAALNWVVEHWKGAVSVRRVSGAGAGFYLLDGKLPLYLKYSKSRRGPWQFNFLQEHQVSQEGLFREHGACITAFICGRDGIAALSHNEMRQVLDENFEKQESVTIRRRHNQMYRIGGRDGKLEKKVSRSSLPTLINEYTATVGVGR